VARWAVEEKGLSIRLACEAFGLSESGYRSQPKLNAENAKIAEWLQRLTESQRNRGFGLCFLYLCTDPPFSAQVRPLKHTP
jgi:putative transposase